MKKWEPALDLGVEIWSPHGPYYVTQGPSGGRYYTSKTDAEASGDASKFRMENEKRLMPPDEWQEFLRQHGADASDHDAVNHPKHYTSHPSGVECIEVTRHMSFNLGNAMKYLWRADEKGAPIEDLEKAAWYINDEIQQRKKDNGKK